MQGSDACTIESSHAGAQQRGALCIAQAHVYETAQHGVWQSHEYLPSLRSQLAQTHASLTKVSWKSSAGNGKELGALSRLRAMKLRSMMLGSHMDTCAASALSTLREVSMQIYWR